MTRSSPFLGLVVALCALTVLLAQTVHAGPLDEARARAHLHAVSVGDLDALMRDYDEDAYMDWVGGALDGRYRGKAAILAVWQKFIAANAGKPRPAKFGTLQAFTNAKGATLEASVEYGGATPVKVRHVLTYREGTLTTEIWQIAPNITLTP